MTNEQLRLSGHLLANCVAMSVYVVIFIKGEDTALSLFFVLLIWGFIAYRWIAQTLLGDSFVVVDVNFLQLAATILFGSIFCAVFGIIIVPFLIIFQIFQLLAISR